MESMTLYTPTLYCEHCKGRGAPHSQTPTQGRYDNVKKGPRSLAAAKNPNRVDSFYYTLGGFIFDNDAFYQTWQFTDGV